MIVYFNCNDDRKRDKLIRKWCALERIKFQTSVEVIQYLHSSLICRSPSIAQQPTHQHPPRQGHLLQWGLYSRRQLQLENGEILAANSPQWSVDSASIEKDRDLLFRYYVRLILKLLCQCKESTEALTVSTAEVAETPTPSDDYIHHWCQHPRCATQILRAVELCKNGSAVCHCSNLVRYWNTYAYFYCGGWKRKISCQNTIFIDFLCRRW